MAKNTATARYTILTRCLAALALMFVYVVSTSAVLVGASTTSAQARGRGGGGRGGGARAQFVEPAQCKRGDGGPDPHCALGLSARDAIQKASRDRVVLGCRAADRNGR